MGKKNSRKKQKNKQKTKQKALNLQTTEAVVALPKTRRKTRLFLIASLALLSVFTSILFLTNDRKITTVTEGERRPPRDVQISNLKRDGFSIQWITDDKEDGQVVIEEARSQAVVAQSTASGEEYLHQTIFTGLEPGGKYIIKIIEGKSVFGTDFTGKWIKDGMGKMVILPRENSQINTVIKGRTVNTENKGIPALISIRIPGTDSLFAGISDNDGEFAIEVGYNEEPVLLLVSAKGQNGVSTSKYIETTTESTELVLREQEGLSPIVPLPTNFEELLASQSAKIIQYKPTGFR